MFSSLVSSIKNWCATFVEPFKNLFSRHTIDEAALRELSQVLIAGDVGYATTERIMQEVRERMRMRGNLTGADLRQELCQIMLRMVSVINVASQETPRVVFLVGVNGSGKTTTAAKLAYAAQRAQKRVLLVAADTFRAAATQQLLHWGNMLNVPVIRGALAQDPASVVFAACEAFKTGTYDLLIIDTAGRLQTKSHLMAELAKLRKVISKQLPHEQVESLLSIDGMLGQNSLQQARVFHESTSLSGIILTKMDGNGKGGIVLAISDQLHIPVRYITTGEGVDALVEFDPHLFVEMLLRGN